MTPLNQFQPTFAFHPGVTLKEKLDELNIGSKELAVRTGKPEKSISEIINGKAGVSAESAIAFERVLKIPAHFWLAKQSRYEEFVARERLKAEEAKSLDWVRLFPYLEMAKLGWIASTSRAEEKLEQILNFFGVQNESAWENIYIHSAVKAQFKLSLSHSKNPQALSAWLRKGDLDAANFHTPDYDPKLFSACLEKCKHLIALHPKDLFTQLQTLCADTGVRLVYTPGLPKAPISGATRWVGGKPVIQMTNRFKRNDHFWFTFFHEAAHILKHGKNDVFLEEADYNENDMAKEEEANNFASEMLLTKSQEKVLVDNSPLMEKEILDIARRFETHPAILIGRLKFLGALKYTEFNQFYCEINLDNL